MARKEGIERIENLVRKGALPSYILDLAKENPEAAKNAMAIELANRKKNYPSINFVPNIGQVKAMECLKAPHPEYGGYPMKIITTGGNGSGKTTIPAAVLLAGLCLGPKFVNQEYCNFQFFHDMDEKRKGKRDKTLDMRIVCDGADMAEGGSFYKAIKEWIPTAEFKGKSSQNYYTQVKIGETIVDVKTFGQDKRAHAGPNLDVIIMNEPCPQDVWDENVGRLRRGGHIFAFLTPLSGAGYLFDVIYDDEATPGSLFHHELSIWDNCEDLQGLKEELRERLYSQIVSEYTRLNKPYIEKDIRAQVEAKIEKLGIPAYADEQPSRGILKSSVVISLIESWYASNPDEVLARRDGRFMHLTGTIFKQFDVKVHVMLPEQMQNNWIIMQTCDPHMAKHPFAMWTAQTPADDIYVIAEYPNRRWDAIKTTNLTIENVCSEMKMIEKGNHERFYYLQGCKVFQRYGDPNMFIGKLPNTRLSFREEYAQHGFDYETKDVVDDVIFGHGLIHERLNYNKEMALSAYNRPRLYVWNTCFNTQLALQRYAYKETKSGVSETPDPKWKCIIDNLRYRLSIFKPYFELKRELQQSSFGEMRSETKTCNITSTGKAANPALVGVGRR